MSYALIIVGSLLLSAFFSGMEIAFVASNKLRLEMDRKQGILSARIITFFTKYPGQYIATMLVGNNIALVIYGLVMAQVLEPVIRGFTNSEAGILVFQTIFSTMLILLTAEFLPKTIFRVKPNLWLNIFALPLLAFYILFYPIASATTWISRRLLGLFNIKIDQSQEQRAFGKIDLDNLVHEAQNTYGQKDKGGNELKLFQNALDFSKVKIRDCMIPRTEIAALDIESEVDELRQKCIETGLSRILVFRDNIDNIVGYVNAKELFKNPKTIKAKLNQVSFVPETMPANKLLKVFMQEHKTIAVVVDEFGGTAGILTLEDLMEEIFGDIDDEHDSIEHVEQIVGENEYMFSARLEIEYLNEKYQLKIPESDEYDTLAGFILYHHQNIPMPQDEVNIPPFRFKIVKVSRTRLELVNLVVEDD